MDLATHEKARELRAKASHLEEELAAWKKGRVGLGRLNDHQPERFELRHFQSAVVGTYWPAFAASCVADLERRLLAVEQEFAAL